MDTLPWLALPPEVLQGTSNVLPDSINLPMLLTALSHDRQVYCLQVGANDGVLHDPIHQFIRTYGWKGLLVEPLPDVFAQLKQNYRDVPGLAFENAAIAEVNGEKELLRIDPAILDKAPDWAAGCATFHEHCRNIAYAPELIQHVIRENVRTMTMPSLLANHQVQRVDMLQVDTEGYDYIVLNQFDFKRYDPAVIHMKFAHLQDDEKSKAKELLKRQGYVLRTQHLQLIAVKRAFLVSLHGRATGATPPAPPPLPAMPVMLQAAKTGWKEPASLIFMCFALFVGFICLCGHLQLGLNNDNLALTDQTRRLLEGEQPYVDYIDVSPPLVHMLLLGPVWIALHTGITMAVMMKLSVALSVALALLTSQRILIHGGADMVTRRMALGICTLALLGTAFMHQSFATRDYLTIVFSLPWFVLYSPFASRMSVPRRWRLCAAGMAAIGFAIKPYFYIFYAACVAYAWWIENKKPLAQLRQREHQLVLGFGVLYLIGVFVFFPNYPLSVVPLGWQTYGGISWSLPSKLDIIAGYLFGEAAVVAMVASLALLITAPERFGRGLVYLYFLLAAALGSYLLNGGWYYTQYPFLAIAMAIGAVAGAQLLSACEGFIRHRRLWFAAIAVLLALGLGYFNARPALLRAQWDLETQRNAGYPLESARLPQASAERIMRHLETHPRFIMMSYQIWAGNLMDEGLPPRNVGRMHYFWPLPAILHMQDKPWQKAQYEKLARWFALALADNLERQKPDMVINDISLSQIFLPPNYNVLELLTQYDEFNRQWEGYRLAERFNICSPQNAQRCAFEIYIRK